MSNSTWSSSKGEKQEQICQDTSSSYPNGSRPCRPGQLYEPNRKTCIAEHTPIPPPTRSPCTTALSTSWESCTTMPGCSAFPPPTLPPCTTVLATSWESGTTAIGCSDDGIQNTMEECQIFTWSAKGKASYCTIDELFSPTLKEYETPLSVSVAACPPFPRYTVTPAKYWGDCKDVTDCSADNPSEITENQCQTYQCSLSGDIFSCEGGKEFCPDQKFCMEPLNVASCPYTANGAEFCAECKDITGCSADKPSEGTENQCQTYQCSLSGDIFSCEGGKEFCPDQNFCVEPLNVASGPCTAIRAKLWGDCKDVTGCSGDKPSEGTESQSQTYQCSLSGEIFSCEGGKEFCSDQNFCVEPLNDASFACTANRTEFWCDCKDVTGSSEDKPSVRICINDEQRAALTEALVEAARNGDEENVRKLLNQGALINAIWNEESALTVAARWNHLNVVKLLLEKGALVSQTDDDGWPALTRAARWGHHEVVKLLIEKGAVVNQIDCGGGSAMTASAYGGHIDVVDLLLQKGGNVEQTDQWGRSALTWAAGEGHADVVKLLLEKGASVDRKDGSGLSALITAAGEGHHQVIDQLIRKGASVDLQDNWGRTALIWAASVGHETCVCQLLDKGASVHIQNEDNCTALEEAKATGQEDIVNILTEVSKIAPPLQVCCALVINDRVMKKDTLKSLPLPQALIRDLQCKHLPKMENDFDEDVLPLDLQQIESSWRHTSYKTHLSRFLASSV